MKTTLTFLFLLFLSSVTSLTFAQDKSNISISLVENDNIASVNIDQESFMEAIKSVIDISTATFGDYPDSVKIVVLITFHKDKEITATIYSKPEISEEDSKAFYSAIEKMKFPRTNIVDFPVLVTINVEGGMNNESIKQFLPTYQQINNFRNSNLEDQALFIRNWTTTKALPVIQAYEQKVDKQFEGVLKLGNSLAKLDYSKPIDVDKLTKNNSNYWRAMLEMSKGNLLIPMTKIMLLASQNNFDYAKKYSEILEVFSQKGGVSDDYMKDFNFYVEIMINSVTEKINEAIALHDQQNYNGSIKKLDEVLAIYPSSWAMHEKYLSETNAVLKKPGGLEQSKELWTQTRKEIFKINPLYGYDLQMSNKKEAYSFYLRQEIGKLFSTNENILDDMYSYADIAVKLEDYDFAAHLYWQLFSTDPKNPVGLNRFLFCLEKLGIADIKKNFKGNFEKEFSLIEKQLDDDFKNNIFTKMFKD